MRHGHARTTATLMVAVLLGASCSGGSDSGGSRTTFASTSTSISASLTSGASTAGASSAGTSTSTTSPVPATSAVPAAPATFRVRPGVNQIAVLGATPGQQLELVAGGAGGAVAPPAAAAAAAAGTVDAQGSLLFRGVPAGTYVVRAGGSTPSASAPAVVTSEDDVPAASFYAGQQLPAGGFGYLTTRDGTTLSVNVLLPGPADGGPYPTIVEYSGYQPSDPGSTTFGSLFNALGFAYVGVNMRGTGCSGGSYQFFERAQSVDGYDVIETVAAQPWVLGHEVGMGGISYPGISQLFVASTAPPSLAAITPLSVIDDAYRATGYPGGILNTGFAAPFAEERFEEAKVYGQAWTQARADAGDTVCATNQELRLQNPDFRATTESSAFDDPVTGDPLAPATFVDRIDVPVFLSGAWQDEQTGGHFPDMLDDFTGSPHLYADLLNGLHTDSLSPDVFARMVEFLDLYVAHRTPTLAGARAVAQALVPQLYGVSDVVLPPDRFEGMSYEQALAAFEAEPPIRVLFEQGAGGAEPGAPYPRFTAGFASWPVPNAVGTTWYLADGGALSTEQQAVGTVDQYRADPTALPPTFYAGGRSSDIWKAGTVYDWRPIPAGTGVAYVGESLASDVVVVGSGSVDLWISSTAPDTDLEVTISEVRSDGSEMYIQSGWLRASHRRLDEAASTPILPVQTHLATDVEALPSGSFVPLRIELFPFAYAFRAGSRVRITVDAPGNSRPVWAFDSISNGETVTIAHDAEHPSRVVLPVVPGIIVPADVPACGSLRGQPCRTSVGASTEDLPVMTSHR